MLSLMQLVPGLTPQLDNGNFEGATYSANGREDQSNLFLVDGVHNKDDRGGAFTQVSMTIDAFSEYNVMTHDYGAEYGGASGVIVNAVTKSGTNLFHGSGYYYGQDDRFNASNYFTKLRRRREAGERQPDPRARASAGRSSRTRRSSFSTPSGSGSRTRSTCSFPRWRRPWRRPSRISTTSTSPSTFGRVDYQLTPSHNFSVRTIWNPNTGIGEIAESEQSTERELSLRTGQRADQQLPVDRRVEQPDAQRGQGEQHL